MLMSGWIHQMQSKEKKVRKMLEEAVASVVSWDSLSTCGISFSRLKSRYLTKNEAAIGVESSLGAIHVIWDTCNIRSIALRPVELALDLRTKVVWRGRTWHHDVGVGRGDYLDSFRGTWIRIFLKSLNWIRLMELEISWSFGEHFFGSNWFLDESDSQEGMVCIVWTRAWRFI